MTESPFVADGRAVIAREHQALAELGQRLDDNFARACHALLECAGRVVVVGMGKSSHIGGKIASTLASTGTPAFFVHPGEASHGDLGMIMPGDLVIAISNSGETPEVLTILPIIKRMGVTLLAMTGRTTSSLGAAADVCLDVSVEREACPHNLAPTASTTATLAMGDALAVAVLKARDFSADDFARSHPGGALGRRLLVYVRDVMHTGDALPLVTHTTSLLDALAEMSAKRLGMIGIIDDDGLLCGIYTDGDLRRSLNQGVDVNRCEVGSVMVQKPHTIPATTLAAEVVELMQRHSINGVFVVDADGRPAGALNALDLIRAGVF
ncbi:MAG: KpsF/GutQ family sugar-phosphate isomerase [Acidiferrobacteraceae bacterium]|jgi:arabinose-5-phosphate isomerase|nr:KpsF/GutQ family sugar-phosphate isomerase [Acidiferrobacteraceae bacterium]MBT3769605.1 KpsF/GutQ family sugar-phosphate isomerase [Acidiferrobacteraceae bacterium]MBT4395536.1 KpsF/GutQ family sugar-phosphate isomerase [Acidiferrobacteraceae bacterium]MBT4404387.1 KpsF/GutQ family sugar-phosphate isomerase [Acidiferrobacteraceae bacterium]MBT5621939.1 KpsF/GutQ family sugar-phosphate isomerase [Acidiferrobacteraceae bacterium]